MGRVHSRMADRWKIHHFQINFVDGVGKKEEEARMSIAEFRWGSTIDLSSVLHR